MRPVPDAFYVHLGVHSTGARTFQKFLQSNRTKLGRIGYSVACSDDAVPSNQPCRISSDSYVLSKRVDVDRCEAVAGVGASTPPRMHGMILSDLNIMGGLSDMLAGRFASDIRERAVRLRNVAGRPVDHLAVSVQAYDMAFLDAWRWLALERTLDPFERYADTMAGFSGGWVEAVEILRETLEVQKVTIVLADPSPAELLTLLVPECGQVDLVGVAPQPVLTDSAVAMVQRQKKQGVSYAPGQLDRIVAFHGRQPQAQRSYGFEGLMLADLRGRYVADLDALARMPGVTTLGQTISAMAAE